MNASKGKSLYIQITCSQKQFYEINSFKINFCRRFLKDENPD